MPEFFLELFSEEIPARMQAAAADELLIATAKVFGELKVSNKDIETFCGPRRIAISASLAAGTSGGITEVRGPKESAPQAALNGFLGKYKVQPSELIVEDGYYVFRRSLPSISALQLLAEELPVALENFNWPKSMRWGQSGDFTWVRPLRRIVCLLDGEVIPVKLGPVIASNETEGHRFLSPSPFTVSSASDWQEKLRSHYVIADQDVRKQLIRDGLKTAAEKLGLSIAEDEGLLEEVSGLVEWPVPLIGKIDTAFMDLPPEVRELSMKVNQRYFAMRNAQGKPAPYFAFVANIEAKDGGAQIIAGNERVLRARLSDAWHFWELDLKTPLDALLPKLEKITFHAKIGNQRERAERIALLASQIVLLRGGDSQTSYQAETAGRLAKADLVTGMVGEFPELQGVMGGYYAENKPRGWDGAIVGPAIRTHYQPKGPNDDVPYGMVPIAVALADKIDMLVQFFGISEKPTGSGDPYALRRAALGIIRIILENNVALHLKPLFNSDNGLFTFILERLRIKLRGDGKRFDILDAVLGAGEDDDLVRIMRRVDAVTAFLDSPDGANLLAAYRRAASILKIEDAKDGPHTGQPDPDQFLEIAEYSLSNATNLSSQEINQMITQERFVEAMRALSYLREPIDAFFDKVTVNAAELELRCNRLKLLARFRDTADQIADFSKIEA